MNADREQPVATLDIFDPDVGMRSLPIAGGSFKLGRHRDNDLKIPDNFVSRHHAEIVFDGTNFVFRDHGSSCGSFVNGRKTDEKVLRDGDSIRLGRKDARELTFRCADGTKSGSAPAEEQQRIMTVIDETQTRFLNTSLLKMLSSTGEHSPAPATMNRLSALYEATSVMLALKDRQDVSEKLLNLVFENLTCERGVIMVYDQKQAALQPQVMRSTVDSGNSFSPSRTVTERAYDENVAVLSMDASNDSRFAARESIILQAIRSVMCAPIASSTRVWGVLYVDTVTTKKTFEHEDLEFLLAMARQAGIAMENLFLLEEQRKTIESFIRALAASIDARDDLTAGHSARVGRYSSAIAKYLGWTPEERKRLYYAGLLHDYGKIGTREAILCKPGRLTPDEYEHIKEHPGHTMRILSQIHFTEDLQDLPLIASSHHEKMDGTGYPYGLVAEQIPIGSRIIAVADFFDALTHKRHYREPMPIEEVISLVREQTGTAFDSDVVDAFEQFARKEYIPNQEKRAARDASLAAPTAAADGAGTSPTVE
jgi:HD-GYP domain-containing protein (c-di-GMP phosphodiesterase class II)/pSer/pThr/pTyr-binding forkhead associated (FHA) protein